jgi:Flp pilus assembly protein TadG
MKQNDAILEASRAMRSRVESVRSRAFGRGQAAVEFALVATVAMIVLFVAVQLALIGEDALALGQMNYQGARWAAVNTCATNDQIIQYILSVGSPSVTMSGGTCGAQLTAYLTDTNHTNTKMTGTTCTTPTGIATTCAATAQRKFGDPVTINLQFDASKAIFLSNSQGSNRGWLGVIHLPTTLQSTETAMAE